jgi:hypothetical protein
MKPAGNGDSLRGSVYAVIITVAAGLAVGRILAATRSYEPYLFRAPGDTADSRGDWPVRRPVPMPTFGANDRSRWATIRALVDEGTYIIGRRSPSNAGVNNPYGDEGIVTEDGWQTIDKVLRPDTQSFYSSKPPLLPTLLAGEYWLLKRLFGWSITDWHGQVIRTILLTVNVLPYVIYLIVLARIVDRLGQTDWARVYVVAAGAFGTFVTTFLVTLNNHSIAAWSVLFALYHLVALWTQSAPVNPPRISPDGTAGNESQHAGFAGFFAGFAACMELPAIAFVLAVGVLLMATRPQQALKKYVPAALVPFATFVLTNYLAIGQVAPAYSELEGPWYQYPGSYWDRNRTDKSGIDWASEDKATYSFHLLLGHHGLFSLTPIFCLSLVGMGIAGWSSYSRRQLRRAGAQSPDHLDKGPSLDFAVARLLAGLTFVLTLTVVGFYVMRTNNYGGWTSAPRWLMWLTPLLLLTMLPALDWLWPKKGGRLLAYLLLAVSVVSVSYPAWNPWRHPWLFDWMASQGWITY